MHYGTLTSQGGIVKLVVMNGGKPYVGSERKGIKSEPRQADSRSFKVLGDIKDACNFFEEKYLQTNVFENYEHFDAENGSAGPSDWTFT
jgi:hypothetical protein